MMSPPLPQPKHLNMFSERSNIKEGVFSLWKTQQHFLRFFPAFSREVPGHKSITSWLMSTLDLMVSMYFSFIISNFIEKKPNHSANSALQQLVLMILPSSLIITGDKGRIAVFLATHNSLCCQECGEPPRRKLMNAVKRPFSPRVNCS